MAILAKSKKIDPPFTLSQKQAQAIGNKIWFNESKKSIEKLTWWNEGEEFASLGIGHFIWYPAHIDQKFTELFPSLLAFFKQHNVSLPSWLANTTHCPWKTKNEFFDHFSSKRMKELRKLLASTIHLQTQFIMEHALKSLPKMCANLPAHLQNHITQQFNRLIETPQGIYVLIDYVHFKGDGTSPKEQYNGKGWGLKQVLQAMQGTSSDKNAVHEFAQHAKKLLAQRVANANPTAHEERFLAGWNNRINTYLQA